MASHVQKLNSKVSNSIRTLSPVLAKLDIEKRKQLVMAKITSQVDYGLAIYLGQTDDIRRKINTVRMKCYNAILRENV